MKAASSRCDPESAWGDCGLQAAVNLSLVQHESHCPGVCLALCLESITWPAQCLLVSRRSPSVMAKAQASLLPAWVPGGLRLTLTTLPASTGRYWPPRSFHRHLLALQVKPYFRAGYHRCPEMMGPCCSLSFP